jgi:hypothetical protein
MQSFCALGNEILRFSVDQADHGSVRAHTPCHQLHMGGEDGVRGGGWRSADGMEVTRREIFVELLT